jgi:hypothetical protein
MRGHCAKIRRKWPKPSVNAAVLMMAALVAQYHYVRADDEVSIELTGQIETECRIQHPSQILQLGELQASNFRTLEFELHCNTPFQYLIRSLYGGLKNIAQHTDVSTGFLTLVPYDVQVTIPTDVDDIQDQCSSQQIQANASICQLSNSGEGISLNQTSTITIQWNADQNFTAGTFTDVLTMNLMPIL